MILTIYIFTGTSGYIFPDEQYYIRSAVNLTVLWEQGNLFDPEIYSAAAGSRNWLYPAFVALHFLIFPSPLLPAVTNALLGSLTCILIYLLSRQFFSENAARLSLIISILFPHMIFFSGLVLKDTLVVFLLILGTYYWSKFCRSNCTKQMIAGIVTCLILIQLRFYTGILLLFIFFMIYLFSNTSPLLKRIQKLSVFVFFISLAAFFLPEFKNMAADLFLKGPWETVKSYSYNQWQNIAHSNYYYSFFTTGEISIKGYLFSAAHFLLTPNPFWQTGWYQLLVPGIFFWFFLILRALHGLITTFKIRPAFMNLSIPFVALILFHGFLPWISDVRHQLQIIPFAVILASFSILNYKRITIITPIPVLLIIIVMAIIAC